MKAKHLGVIVVVAVLLSIPTAGLAKTEIVWWHAMTGFLGEKVNEIATKFNGSQADFEVKPSIKEVILKH